MSFLGPSTKFQVLACNFYTFGDLHCSYELSMFLEWPWKGPLKFIPVIFLPVVFTLIQSVRSISYKRSVHRFFRIMFSCSSCFIRLSFFLLFGFRDPLFEVLQTLNFYMWPYFIISLNADVVNSHFRLLFFVKWPYFSQYSIHCL